MKKIFGGIGTLLLVLLLVGCGVTKNSDALKFKEDYEKLNGVETSTEGKFYRTITIDEENPFVYTTLGNVVDMIMNHETFFVYFGANWCPWCRSVLPTAIREAKEAGIDKIYYVDVRPDNIMENDIRDLYSLDENGEPYLSHKGLEDYKYFLMYADKVLSTYSLHGVVIDDVKRVGAPNFFFVEDGNVNIKVTGISSQETDPYMDLTDEINDEMTLIFKDFFDQMK